MRLNGLCVAVLIFALQATPMVSLAPTPDGCSVLAGQGWQPGDQVVVNVGQAEFHVRADEQGGFVQPIALALGPGTDVVYSWRRQGDAAAISVAHAFISTGAAQAQVDRSASVCDSPPVDGTAPAPAGAASVWELVVRPFLIVSVALLVAIVGILVVRRAVTGFRVSSGDE